MGALANQSQVLVIKSCREYASRRSLTGLQKPFAFRASPVCPFLVLYVLRCAEMAPRTSAKKASKPADGPMDHFLVKRSDPVADPLANPRPAATATQETEDDDLDPIRAASRPYLDQEALPA